jgi:8-oxo-dGTP pyrophosphatase MutT (NUDIX family)
VTDPDRFRAALRRRLAASLPGVDAQLRMAPRLRAGPEPDVPLDALRPAAALLLVYPHAGHWHIPLTVRGPEVRHHTGQVSLPGGRVDPGESIEAAAVREAHEEVGVAPGEVDVLGRLTPLPVWVSGHLLHPVVGAMASRPRFTLAAGEVERLIEIPVPRLREPGIVAWEERVRSLPPHAVMDVPYFDVEGAHVWGATAMVLAEFLALVEETLDR